MENFALTRHFFRPEDFTPKAVFGRVQGYLGLSKHGGPTLEAVLAKVVAGACYTLYGAIEEKFTQAMLPTHATEERLDAWAQVWDLSRLPAEKWRLKAEVRAPAQTRIPKAHRFTCNGLVFKVEDEAVLNDRSAIIHLEAIDAGAFGARFAVGDKVVATPTLPGVSEVVLVQAPIVSNGRDRESDVSLRARLLNKIRRPSTVGTFNDYLVWARASGAPRAFVGFEFEGVGAHLIKTVVVLVDQKHDVERVRTFLAQEAPLAASFKVLPLRYQKVSITMKGPKRLEIQAIKEIEDFFKSAFPAPLGCFDRHGSRIEKMTLRPQAIIQRLSNVPDGGQLELIEPSVPVDATKAWSFFRPEVRWLET